MAFDVKKWRDAGVPADLIAILVDVNRAAGRIPSKGDKGVGIASLVADAENGGIVITLTDGSTTRVTGLTANLSQADQDAIASALSEMSAVLNQAAGFAEQAGAAASAGIEAALDDLPLSVVDLDIEAGHLIKIMADGSRLIGPLLPIGSVDPGEEVSPALAGGGLEMDGDDLIIVAPSLIGGIPVPEITLALTRDGVDVTGEIVDGRISDAPLGDYLAIWIAANGVLPNSTRTASLVIAAPALVAPAVAATASISRAQTGTLLDGPDDTVTGNPQPSPSYQWFNGNDPIPNATGKSYDPGSALGAFARQTTWSNGVGLPAVSRSNTITIAAVPAIELVSVTPNPIIAGQPFELNFNVSLAENEVTANVPLTGTGTKRSGTAPADDTINISGGASKAGYTSLPFVFDVQPAPPQIVATSANLFQAQNVDASTPDFPITFTGGPYAGTYTAKPSVMATGPQFLVNPKQTGGTAVGAVHTADLGVILNLESGGPVSLTYRWLRGSTAIPQSDNAPYTAQAADQGQTLKLEVTAEDAKGKRVYTEAGIAIPAASSIDTFDAARADLDGATTESGETWARMFGSNPGVLLVNATGEVVTSATAATSPPIRYRRGAADRGATQHAWAEILKTGSGWQSISLGVCMQPNDLACYVWAIENNLMRLQRYAADGTVTTLITVGTSATDWPVWNAGQTRRWDLKRSSAGVLRVELDGAMFREITNTTLSSGASGLVGLGQPTNFRVAKFGIGA